MTEGRKQYYSSLEKEIMGRDFKFKVERIKDEQCYCCKNRNNIKTCRLNINDGSCINYEKMDKRKC